MNVNCGAKLVALVPPVNVALPVLLHMPFTKAVCHLYRVRQLFGLMLVLFVVLTNGAQPVLGDSVKAGCGGASTQMHLVMESTPQAVLPVYSLMQ
ncbi:MAG: hypothetical protein QM724_14025 [Flavobacteriales bacterium]